MFGFSWMLVINPSRDVALQEPCHGMLSLNFPSSCMMVCSTEAPVWDRLVVVDELVEWEGVLFGRSLSPNFLFMVGLPLEILHKA